MINVQLLNDIDNIAMPPKRKTSAPAGGDGKKAKTEPAAQQSSARQMADALKKAGGDDRKKTAKVDTHCALANSGHVSWAARQLTDLHFHRHLRRHRHP